MKILTLVVHATAQQELADRLRTLEQVPGFTFSHVEGHGAQAESDLFLSARDKVVGYTPRVRVDILLADGAVEAVLAALRDSPGVAGQGVYWVADVAREGRL